VKTTLDLPDELMRAIKIRAVKDNRKLKDAIADLLKRGLAREPVGSAKVRQRVRLPLVRCAHRAREGEEITPKRAAEILLEEESEADRGAMR
jgi:plasmid stability protein